MAGIFDTTDVSGPQETTLSVKQPIAPPKDVFGLTVAEKAVEGGMSAYKQKKLGEQEEALEDISTQREEALGQMRLKALTDKFDVLATGMEQGLPTAQANARARAALAETKAAVPWIGNEADEAFTSYFGGSSKGFTLSPMEEAAQAVQEKIATTAATMNISLKSAQMVVETEAHNNANEQILRQKKINQQANVGAFRTYTNNMEHGATVTVQAKLKGLLPPGDGALKPESMNAMHLEIDSQVMQMKQKLRAGIFNKEGKPLMSFEDTSAMEQRIDAWGKEQKDALANRSYLNLIKSLKEQYSYETEIAAKTMLPVISLVDSAGGQVAVDAMLKGLMNPKYVPTLVAQYPPMAKFFNDDSTMKQVTAAGIVKAYGFGQVLDPVDWADNAMEKGGAQSTQAYLRENPSIAYQAYSQTTTENPEVAQAATTFHRQAGAVAPTETSRTLAGRAFREYADKHPDEGFKVMTASLEGMTQAFRQAYFNAEGVIPEYVSVTSNIEEAAAGNREALTQGVDPYYRSFVVKTSDGMPVPPEAKEAMASQYRILKENPQYVQSYEQILGIPLTEMDVLEIMVNGKLHPKFKQRYKEQVKAGGFKGRESRTPQFGFSAMLKQLKGNITTINPSETQGANIFGEEKLPAATSSGELSAEEMAVQAPIIGNILGTSVTQSPMTYLTEEQVAEIQSLPSLEEKKAKAIEYGVPKELVEQATRGQ